MKADYDLLIIGAGIHGAAVARHAALDGFKVCVVEQFDQPALATSSRSSKLIHGGLRYLESHQFRLVRECLIERSILLKTAPSLVRLEAFYLPVYRYNKRPAWIIHLGLLFYRLLGGGRFKKIPRSQWHGLDGLNTEQLRCVYQYHDAVTDDRQLTRAVLDDAIANGADFRVSHRVSACHLNDQHVRVEFEQQPEITAKLVINAAGPWVNHVLEKTSPKQPAANIDLVQGTHILIPRQLQRGVYYFEAKDQRVIFAIPWKNQCLLGTTETPFHDEPERVNPLSSEISYLLAAWNQAFNDHLDTDDLIDAFAGLRVLPSSTGAAFSRSRDTEIRPDPADSPRIISIIGGKLTAHRITAERVMKIIHRQLPGHQPSSTCRRPLISG